MSENNTTQHNHHLTSNYFSKKYIYSSHCQLSFFFFCIHNCLQHYILGTHPKLIFTNENPKCEPIFFQVLKKIKQLLGIYYDDTNFFFCLIRKYYHSIESVSVQALLYFSSYILLLFVCPLLIFSIRLIYIPKFKL